MSWALSVLEDEMCHSLISSLEPDGDPAGPW